jgi:antitoxin component of MazEF toxin-antitoxin module
MENVMSVVKIREDGNSNVVTIPVDIMRKARLSTGDHVEIEVDEDTGRVELIPMQIKPRARYDFHEVVRDVIGEERELLDRLAEYDRGQKS